jgi:hypothetical protein
MWDSGPARSAMPNTAATPVREVASSSAHRLCVDGQRPLGVPARVDRPGQRQLGEHRDLAALDPGLLEHGRMRRQVAVEIALLGVQGGEQDPHHIPPDQRRPAARTPGPA